MSLHHPSFAGSALHTTMEGSAIQDEQLDSTLDPPPRIFERLSQIAGYTWDESASLTHSSYDNWYV